MVRNLFRGLFVLLLAFSTLSAQAQQGEDTSNASQAAQSSADHISAVGSPYVELDSWIYPAIERLAALGYIHSEFLDTRPWTRTECANLIREAGNKIEAESSVPEEVDQLYSVLEREFTQDIRDLTARAAPSMRVESLYTNLVGIDGTPLNDSDHFGQTLINNYGRPYQEGFNTWDGFSGYGSAGRFVIYVRGEYQHAQSAPAYPLSVRQQIASMDNNPLQPAIPVATTNRFTLLDTYAAAQLAGWNLAFGKQSFWWGPGYGGDLMLTDNAEPIYAFRASRVTPFTLPWIFSWLGPMKVDAFVGKLSGNEFPPRPLFHGERFSFKPTKNLEFGIARTGEFAGVGRALTLGAIWNTYFVFNQSSVNYPAYKNPGKRTGSVDFSYRVPFARDWLTIYTSSLSSDDPSPLSNPPRAAWNPGLYMPQLPRLRKMDFRVEAVNTNLPVVVYYETFYHDLYTNHNNIMGSWIGRSGLGVQSWSTYWLSPRNKIQFGYRNAKVAKDFVPGGETLNDGSVKVDWWLSDDFSFSGSIQYEKWSVPLLAGAPQTNWTSSINVTFWPRMWGW